MHNTQKLDGAKPTLNVLRLARVGFPVAAVLLCGFALVGPPIAGKLVAHASPCLLLLSEPALRTVTSGGVRSIEAGEQIVITTQVTACAQENSQLVAIVEARNSHGVTEFLGWQSAEIDAAEAIEFGLSWIPLHSGNYELRTFAISGFDNPRVLSTVMTSDVSIAEPSNTAVIVIPHDEDPSTQQVSFEPSVLKVVLGVNNTVIWRNDDNVSRTIIPDPDSPDDFDFDAKQVYLYPGHAYSHVFTEAGSFHYVDADRQWMRGIVWVIPSQAIQAYLDISINGLRDSYKLGEEPVEFSVDIAGFETGCGHAEVIVERIEDGRAESPSLWSTSTVFDCFSVAAPYTSINLHLPAHDGPFYVVPVEVPGTYRLTASFESDYTLGKYLVTRDFVVT
jgi:plastocyanin